jgi:hypothetical protein
MQQRTRRLAIILGGTLFASVGLVLAACSTDNGTSPLPGQTGDASRRDTSTGSRGGEDEQDGEAPEQEAGADADCRDAPRLRDNDQGFFCAFLPFDAGGAGRSNCSHDETCCNPAKVDGGFPKTFCASTPRAEKGGTNGATACAAQAAAKGSIWTNGQGTTWECGDKNNCDTGQVCCMFTDPAVQDDKVNIGKNLNKQIPAACDAKQAFKYGGTRCARNCAADEIQLCSNTDQNCQGGKTCYPFEVYPGGRNLGYCR